MLILLTGAAGNLGSSVARRLVADGHRVRAFDIPSPRNRRVLEALHRKHPDLVELCFGNITHDADVEAAARGVDGVAHLAALLPTASERNPAATRAVNVEGTRRLVHALEASGRAVPFVLSSSCSVYGPDQPARGIAGPDDPIIGTDAYSNSKVEAEALLRSSSLAWVILRIGAAIEGSAAVTDALVMRLMFEVNPENPIEVVHGEDVATAVVNALFRPEAHRRVFPIGGGPSCQLTQRELFATTLDLLGVGEFPANAFGTSPYYTCWMDTRESQRVLGFQSHDIEAIKRDVAARVGPFGPLVRLFGPLTRRFLLRYSGPMRGDPARPTWQELIDAGY